MNNSNSFPIISDRFTISSTLGVGGMAIVYRADDIETNRSYALKLLKKEYTLDTSRVQRFKQEYELLNSIKSSSVIKVYDYGVTSQGIPFYTMELLSGATLQQLLSSGTIVTTQRCLELLSGIARALKDIHDQRIVFCDLTPSNIFINESSGAITIMDFGIAQKLVSTHTNAVEHKIGTPEYMSPEQYQKAPLTTASDIYSFGVVAYELLTRKLPFDPEIAYKIEFFHKLVEVPSLREINPTITPALDRLIRRCMEKDLSHRFTSFEPIISRLDELLSNTKNPSFFSRWFKGVQ